MACEDAAGRFAGQPQLSCGFGGTVACSVPAILVILRISYELIQINDFAAST
jgi:hypothetical protein